MNKLDLSKFSADDRAIIDALVVGGAYPDAEAAVGALIEYGKSHPHITALLDHVNEAAVDETMLREAVADYDANPDDAEPLENAFRGIRRDVEQYIASKTRK